MEEVFVFTAEQAFFGEVLDTIIKVFSPEALAVKYMCYFINVDGGKDNIAKLIKRDKWDVEFDEPTLYRAYMPFDYSNNHVECTITKCEITK